MKANLEDFQLHRSVLHRIDKELHEKHNATLQIRSGLLPNTEDERGFVGEVFLAFHTNDHLKSLAKFKDVENGKKPAFQQTLDQYLGTSGNKDQAFYEASKEFTNKLKDEMEKLSAATGGYVLFAEGGLKKGDNYLMVILLNNKRSYSTNEDLDVKPITSLDVDKLQLGGFVNCSSYQSQASDNRYLRFLSGKKSVSDYFAFNFMGATVQEAVKETTKDLVKSAKDFAQTKYPDDENEREAALRRLYDQLKKAHDQKEPVSLKLIGAVIFPKEPDAFAEYVEQEGVKLDSVIEAISPQGIRSLTKFVFKNKEFTLSFDRKLESRNQVRTDRTTRTVTLSEVPESFFDQWEAEFESQDEPDQGES